ncbi:hypothetical protein EDC01DRAFT_166504 [Geopyxis carbonaria]|nr:hypothetical protein EDC01DRAFT_166504 [Geopyxis carbonaria]
MERLRGCCLTCFLTINHPLILLDDAHRQYILVIFPNGMEWTCKLIVPCSHTERVLILLSHHATKFPQTARRTFYTGLPVQTSRCNKRLCAVVFWKFTSSYIPRNLYLSLAYISLAGACFPGRPRIVLPVCLVIINILLKRSRITTMAKACNCFFCLLILQLLYVTPAETFVASASSQQKLATVDHALLVFGCA